MSQKKIVYIVRHGQSVDNALPVFQSDNSPLSDKGLQQALKIADRTKHLHFDALISSPQPRAKQTAHAIAEVTGKKIEFSDLFKERIKPSAINGKPWGDKTAKIIWREWEESLIRPGLKVEDGENYKEITTRADQALAALQARKENSLLVVSHAHFIRTLIAKVLLGDQLTGDLLKRFYELTSLQNTAITVLQYSDAFEEDYRWRLWTLNDHAHFAE